MNRLVHIIALLAGALVANSALAQTGTALPLLPGITPMLTDPRAPVGQTGIPPGATELAAPGISPDAFSGCLPAGSSAGTMFDGGGMSPAPPESCGMTSSAPPSLQTTSTPMTSTTVMGRAAIPLGSVELGLGGLSPPPPSTPPLLLSMPSGMGALCPGAGSSLSPGSC